jgi:phosphate transport system substrate-binding protein
MEKVVGTLAEQFRMERPDIVVTVEGGGSGAGVAAAADGAADIGLASRALKAEETGLTGTLLALDGIAVIVNDENPVTDLTVAEIGAIYRGEISNWSAVGGGNLTIACIGRESGSGTRDGFESVTGTEGACVLAQELISSGAVIEAVRGNPQAIGYAALSAVEDQAGVRAVTVDGVTCTENTILEGSYAIQRPFYLVTGANVTPAAQAFLDYATSTAAGDLIRSAGAVPVA